MPGLVINDTGPYPPSSQITRTTILRSRDLLVNQSRHRCQKALRQRDKIGRRFGLHASSANYDRGYETDGKDRLLHEGRGSRRMYFQSLAPSWVQQKSTFCSTQMGGEDSGSPNASKLPRLGRVSTSVPRNRACSIHPEIGTEWARQHRGPRPPYTSRRSLTRLHMSS